MKRIRGLLAVLLLLSLLSGCAVLDPSSSPSGGEDKDHETLEELEDNETPLTDGDFSEESEAPLPEEDTQSADAGQSEETEPEELPAQEMTDAPQEDGTPAPPDESTEQTEAPPEQQAADENPSPQEAGQDAAETGEEAPASRRIEGIRLDDTLTMNLEGVLPEAASVTLEKTDYTPADEGKEPIFLASLRIEDADGTLLRSAEGTLAEFEGETIRALIREGKTPGLITDSSGHEAKLLHAEEDSVCFQITGLELIFLFSQRVDTSEAALPDGQTVPAAAEETAQDTATDVAVAADAQESADVQEEPAPAPTGESAAEPSAEESAAAPVAEESIPEGPVTPGMPYLLANAQGGQEYVMGETVTNSAEPIYALGKTTAVSQAGRFCFEYAGEEGVWYLYTLSGGVRQYLSFAPYGNNQAARVSLVAGVPGESGKISLIPEGDAFYIRWNSGTRDYYLNKFGEYGGSLFAAWYSAGNPGSRMRLIPAPEQGGTADPLALDGETLFLVYGDRAAAAAGTQTRGGVAALKSVPVTQTEIDGATVYSCEDASAALWTVHANGDGSYALSADSDGTTRYLHLDAPRASYNHDVSLSLADEPQRLTLDRIGGRVVIYGESNKTRLYCPDGELFAARYKKEKPEAADQITLGKLAGAVLIYQLAPSSEDAGDNRTLASSTAVKLRSADSLVGEPAVASYTADDALYRYVYTFKEWLGSDGKTYHPGDALPESEEQAVFTLRTVWELSAKTERTHTVLYDLALPVPSAAGRSYTPAPAVLGATAARDGTATAEVSGSFALHYTVLGLDTCKIVTNDLEEARAFAGWQTESGTTVMPGDAVNLAGSGAEFDADRDGTVRLTARWSGSYDNGKNRELHFYISTKALSSDVFDLKPQLSTAANDFTEEVFSTLMLPAEYPALTAGGSGWAFLVNYQPRDGADVTTTDITEANSRIRQLSDIGIQLNGTTFTALDFPDDEEIFANIQRYIKPGQTITLDGQAIPPEELNSDNFTIRWYVCKYQGMTNKSDYWHIDGKLTPKVSFVTVTKTFAGDENALRHIPSDFQIVMTNSLDSDNVLTLLLSDQTARPEKYGLISGDMIRGSYGYIRAEENTYTWLIPVARGANFRITEKNYDITADGVKYGIAAQYSVVNPAEEGHEAQLQQWFGTVPGYSATYPVTEIDFSSIQTTNLYNTYVETGTFILQKRDSGTNYAAMPGVAFRVYELTDEGRRLLTLSKKNGAEVNDGRYTVLYENGEISDVASTGADGNIYLTLPRPAADAAIESYTFQIEEIVPEGYLRRADGLAPSVSISVDKQGCFAILDGTVAPEGGSVSATSISAPGGEAGEAMTAGVIITNEPQKLQRVSVEKTWVSVDGSGETLKKPVTVVLRGTVNARTLIQRILVLDEGNGWRVDLDDKLPLAAGNRPVVYEVEETRIGAYEAGSEGFSHWDVQYLAPVYRDEAGEELSRNGTGVDAAAAYRVRSIHFSILNEEKNAARIALELIKKGNAQTGGERLDTAQFEVFESDPSSALRLSYQNSWIAVRNGGVVSSAGGELSLKPGRDYFIREILAPDGYALNGELIHVRVDAAGQLSLPEEEAKAAGERIAELSQSAESFLRASLTVYNAPAAQPVVFELVDQNGEPIRESVSFRFSGTRTLDALGAYPAQSWLSDGNGFLREEALYLGKYTLLRESSPYGYEDGAREITLRVTRDGVSVDGTDVLLEKENDRWHVKIVFGVKYPSATGIAAPSQAFVWMLGAGALLLLTSHIEILRKKRDAAEAEKNAGYGRLR